MGQLPEHTKFKIQLSFSLVIALMTPISIQLLNWIMDGFNQINFISLIAELISFVLGFLLMMDTYGYIIKMEQYYGRA